MTFFYPDRTKITRKNAGEQFIKIYSCNYYSDFEARLKEFFGDGWNCYDVKNHTGYDQRKLTVQNNNTRFEAAVDNALELGFCTQKACEQFKDITIMQKITKETNEEKIVTVKSKDAIPSVKLMIYLCLIWKVGRVSVEEYKEADEDEEKAIRIVFHKNCEYNESDKDCVIFYNNKRIVLNSIFFEDVKQIANTNIGLNKTNKEAFLENLLKFRRPNLASTYALALWFFVTKGQSPIYDRYADIALRAIDQNKKVGHLNVKDDEKVVFKGIDSDITETTINYHLDYIAMLNQYFDWEHKIDKERRDIDRALWVYGHMFETKLPEKR